jgi:hypothetical protein
MVPVERNELPTFGLQNRCSTAELNRHPVAFAGKNAAAEWQPSPGHLFALRLWGGCAVK